MLRRKLPRLTYSRHISIQIGPIYTLKPGMGMTKRKSVRETKNMVQTAIWLPREMHEQLKRAGGERGLGEEVRHRLQTTFDAEQRPSDPITDLLADLMRRVALDLTNGRTWNEHRWTYDVLKVAIDELVSSLCSAPHQSVGAAEPATVAKLQAKLQAKYGPDVKPETIGPQLARDALIENAKEQVRRRSVGGWKG